MARTSTLLQLRTWARQLSGTVGNSNVTDAELTALANRHITEVYDALVSAGPADYYASSANITTVAGTSAYAVHASFYQLVGVFVAESSTRYRPLPAMGNGARGLYQPPTSSVTNAVMVEYIPAASTLSADGDTFDGINGWEELVANLMARDTLIKKEGDVSAVMGSIAALQARIASRARNRDRGSPKRVTDLDEVNYEDPFLGSQSSRLACYRLRGGNIELYEPLVVNP